MGTDKRERQKANRQLKLQEMAKEARKRKTKRRGLQIGIGVPVAIALVFGLVYLFGNSDDKAATDATPATTAISSDLGAVSSIDPISTGAAPLPCPAADGSSEKVDNFPAAPEMCIDAAKTYTAEIQTPQGSMTIALDPSKAPVAVNSFVYLARYHYFDGISCHRVVPGFVAQCGDPLGTGSGGPGYSFPDELPAAGEYKIGSLAMANSGPDTNGSQFFIISGPEGVALPPSYTRFGQVTEGLDVVSAIDALGVPGAPMGAQQPSEPVVMQTVTITES
ncbi:MAG: peptidylprolyl isomerase [Ilumatobacteraceae bacterium]